jgi:NADP-dependent 3-hydroxy acid dehydrogenase YdfG
MKMNTFLNNYGEWALVTGASKGIGLEFSRPIAAKGLNVVLVARSEGKLRKLANSIETDYQVEAEIVVADLTDPAGMTGLLEATSDINIGLLVNKFLYYTGKYLQPRHLNTAAFGLVFRMVLRNKLSGQGGRQNPQGSST